MPSHVPSLLFFWLSQMIYIDNLDLGTLSKTHNVFLRIKHFESETQINKMIMEDKATGQGDTAWGKSKVPLHGLVFILSISVIILDSTKWASYFI
jgi:hypothetical protein